MSYVNHFVNTATARIVLMVIGACLAQSSLAWKLPMGEYAFEPITEGVYVMHGPLAQPNPQNQGFMNNPALIIGKNGLILVDPGSSLQVGEKILEEVAKISTLPVVAVFNSHIHGDHWLGNQAVRKAYPDADIYAHLATVAQAKGSEGANWLQLMDRLTEGHSKGTEIVTANKTIANGDRLVIAGEEFRIHALLPSHTNTDIMVEHVGSRTIFAGDNSVIQRLGRFDNSSNIAGNIAALEHLVKQDFELVVPGHGPSGSSDETILPYLDYLKQLRDAVSAGQDAELEDYEIKEQVLPQFSPWSHWVGFDMQFGRNLNRMYLELEDF